MLQIILGRSGYGKTEYIYKKLSELAEESNKRLILIVPDQFSFETEKRILELAGAKNAAKINVWSFNRLSDNVFREYGGITEKRLDDVGKSLTMAVAIKSCLFNLRVFHKATDRLTGLMLAAVDELKADCISPEDLMRAAEKTTGNLQDKTYDVALIYGAYEAILANKYIEPSDILTRTGKILREKDFFKNTIVAFDGFEGFNKQKMTVISTVLRQAETVYMSFCGESLHNNNPSSVFSPIHKTIADICAIAREENTEIKNPIVLSEPKRFVSPELKYIEKNLFNPAMIPYIDECKNVSVFEARDVYDECEYIAATIRKLVMSGKYRYKDISVVCRNPQKYYTIFSGVLEKWNVPCFFSEPKRVDSQPLIRMVLSAFSALKSGFRTEDILTLMKTGLCPVTSRQMSDLENYVFLWKIKGKMWKEDFFRHPLGFGSKWDDSSRELLRSLNDTRKIIIEPLIKFGQSVKDASGSHISEAVYNLLEDYSAEKTIGENIKGFTEDGRRELASAQSQIWQKLMEVLNSFAIILGDKPVSRDEYSVYLRDVLSKEELQDIPVYLDSVTFGTADLLKLQSVKVSFVIGVVQGDFPMIPNEKGIFTDFERKSLESADILFNDCLEEKTKLERFVAYSAFSGASEKLYATYHLSAAGEEFSPSEIIDKLKFLFPKNKIIRSLPREYKVNTYKAALSAYAATISENSALNATLKNVLEENAEYKGSVNSLCKISGFEDFEITDKALSQKMFAGNYFSASQIDVYHHCKFQYFCKYGLNARERKPAEINVMEYGSLMHYLFEAVFSGDFSVYYNDVPALKLLVKELIYKYVNENMDGYDNMSVRDKYRFTRMASTAVELILNVMEELSVSKFKPKFFELPIKDGTEFPPLKIKTPQGNTVRVGGIIDRVDVYDSPKGKYVRVVDYKTGKKEFKLFDVLYGLNLQMLVYLAALSENGRAIPAGVLYKPSSVPNISGDRTKDENAPVADRYKKLCMNGIILDDSQIINAMEEGAAGKFIPTGIKSNGKLTKPENVIEDSQLEIVFEHIKNLIGTMADSLMNGKIQAEPLMVNNNSCNWCPYGSVCLSQKDDRLVENIKIKKDDALSMMER